MIETYLHNAALHHPFRLITLTFICWKTLLFIICAAAPGTGYDTSTSILHSDSQRVASSLPSSLPLTLKFVRWDAIYYLQASSRGHVYEQEWAFGKGLSTIISSLAFVTGSEDQKTLEFLALIGIMVSHFSHFLTALLVWNVADLLDTSASTLGLGASVLHIISPAGIFLSAPYSESPFAFLNVLGFWLYIRGRLANKHSTRTSQSLYIVASGFAFGFATMIRGNGVLSGLPFLCDAVALILDLLRNRWHSPSHRYLITDLISTIIAGSLIAIGLAVPQYLAYVEYCLEVVEPRPWCRKRLPLIYEFVQSHYWNVGFLRYWTISNLPLFLLAVPCLFLMIKSAMDVLWQSQPKVAEKAQHDPSAKILRTLKQHLALPQLVLALLATTNYHIQIITRLSSAYPWWYIWLAGHLHGQSKMRMATYYFVLYGMIQATLFASFLPPA